MATSRATTVEGYLEELPPERRAVIAAVRQVVKRNLPKGYRETVTWGIISYEVPLATFPDTYNGQPLCYAALAAQKNHYALYLMCVRQDLEQERRLKEAFARAGKKLDMGDHAGSLRPALRGEPKSQRLSSQVSATRSWPKLWWASRSTRRNPAAS